MFKLVLFDIDGTLIQTGGAGERAFARVCALEFGIRNGTANLQFAGRTDTAIVREFFTEHSIAPTSYNFRRFFECYVFMLDHLLPCLEGRTLPGVHEFLAKCENREQPPLLGLLTGNIRLGAQIKLAHYDLWHWFEMGAFGDDHEDRNHLAAIARHRGHQWLRQPLQGDEIMVIGDTPRDIECARAIGARVLAVATGKFSTGQLQAEQPDWVATTLAEVDLEALLD
jgi:phosphoglycolate phosphatase-like HAD superfamily hydrolase